VVRIDALIGLLLHLCNCEARFLHVGIERREFISWYSLEPIVIPEVGEISIL
jgi:hypothetical protein